MSCNRQKSSAWWDPASGEVLQEFACASTAHVSEFVFPRELAQSAWQQTPLERPAEFVRNFQRLLEVSANSRSPALLAPEPGKPYAEALLSEILVVLDTTRFLLQIRLWVSARSTGAARQPGNQDQNWIPDS